MCQVRCQTCKPGMLSQSLQAAGPGTATGGLLASVLGESQTGSTHLAFWPGRCPNACERQTEVYTSCPRYTLEQTEEMGWYTGDTGKQPGKAEDSSAAQGQGHQSGRQTDPS